jgi:HPr kinase/phosphorylase
VSGPTADGEIVHATLVARDGAGVLLRGSSGAGKSDLALRLIGSGGGWRLVSDDQVELRAVQSGATPGGVVGHGPAAIAGKLEARGLGVVELPAIASAPIRLVIDLVPRDAVPRMPEEGETVALLGVAVPLLRLHAFDASTPQKIALGLDRLGKS